MQVGLLPIKEVSVRFPQAVQDVDSHRQSFERAAELETSVHPTLPEVAVHLIGL